MSDVLYYETRGKKTVRVGDICFARIQYPGGRYGGRMAMPDIIRYHAPIRGPLSVANARTYIGHLRDLFGVRAFGARLKDKTVIWTLKPKGMTYAKALVYLTAFRYVSDLPKLTKCSLCARTGTEWFKAFQTDHLSDYQVCGESYTNAGHCLMTGVVKRNLSVRAFRSRLRDKRISTVEGHFAPTP